MKNLEVMKNFSLKNIPNLDVCTLGALELFMKQKVPKLNIPYKRPLVIGSGNAFNTARILFENKDAVFADENNYLQKLKTMRKIDGVVLVSSSGSKDASTIAKIIKKEKRHLSLITNTSHSSSEQYLDLKHSYDEYIFPKNREPYTYNTSTYMGMILGHTQENPKKIYEFILKHLSKKDFSRFKKHHKFYLLVPSKFSEITDMLQIKFNELFGRNVSAEVETFESSKHAKTLVPGKELFISFGQKNTQYGEKNNRIHIPLPKSAGYASMMAIGYYLIGRIQAQQEPYFKKNLAEYTQQAGKLFGQKIRPIVE